MKWLMLFVAANIYGCSCMEQYDPSDHKAQIRLESRLANKPVEVLSDEGDIPEGDAGPSAPETAEEAYSIYCASCHGKTGKGEGSPGLVPPPRNFVDKSWQASVDDQHISKTIRQGGTAVGKSALMRAFSETEIPDDLLEKLVAYIREFGK